MTLYNIPMFVSPIDVPTIQRLADFGYVTPPSEGCPPRRRPEAERQLNPVVDDVVEELRRKGVM